VGGDGCRAGWLPEAGKYLRPSPRKDNCRLKER
jgi:hypothetical protein